MSAYPFLVPKPPSPRWLPAYRWLLSSVVVSVVSWVVSTPLIAYYFGIISPIGLFSNLVVVPMAFGVVVLGFSSLVVGSVYQPLAQPLIALNLWLSEAMMLFLEWCMTLPYAVIYVDHFPLWLVFASFGALGLLWYIADRQKWLRPAPAYLAAWV